MKAGLFRQVAVDGLTRQLIHLPACLNGHSGEPGFLLDAELNFNILRLGASWVSVKWFRTVAGPTPLPPLSAWRLR
jgi:hypothetical protein